VTDPQGRRDPLEQLADEFLARYRRGEHPSLTEYAEAHPELAGAIRDLFPALVMIEEAGARDQAVAGSCAGRVAAAGGSLERLGDYRIIREVGRGGMGVVYEAEQVALGRHVALKVLPFQTASHPQRLNRFRREARSAARLHHTNIVPVFDIGEYHGVHYYAMQFIQGQGLDEVLREVRRMKKSNALPEIPARNCDRVTLSGNGNESEVLARAMQTGQFQPAPPEFEEATSHDTTPAEGQQRPDQRSDVADTASSTSLALVSQTGLSAQSDFHYYRSVARIGLQVAEALAYAHSQKVLHRDIKPSNLLLDRQGTVWVTDFGLAKEQGDDFTRTGDVVGTLRYMAPERFKGQADARSDIYSLGITLYELSTLRPAFKESDHARLVRQITQEEPDRPRKINPRIPRDLETIMLKMIDHEPCRRYSSSAHLAEDLRCFLVDRPIRARRTSAPERLLRWCRRNPLVASLATALASLLIMGIVGMIVIDFRLRDAAIQERRLREHADQAKKLAQLRADEALHRQVRLTVAQGVRLMDEEDLLASIPWFVEALRLDQSDSARARIHRMRLASLCRRLPRLVHVCFHDRAIGYAECSQDGTRLVTVGYEDTARLWDLKTGRTTAYLKHEELVQHASFSPDGLRVVTASQDKTARVWDAVSGQPLTPPLEHSDVVFYAAFSRDGRYVVTTSNDHTARVWDSASGRPVCGPLQHAHWVHHASFRPDGLRVVTASDDSTARIWDLTTGQPVGPPLKHLSQLHSASFSPDGRRVVTASNDHTARIWDADTGELAVPPLIHRAQVRYAAFSPDGSLVVTASEDQTAQVWNASTGQAIAPPLRHRGLIHRASFSPDGSYVLTASSDSTARVWDARSGDPVGPPLRHAADIYVASFTADGHSVLTAGQDRTARVWDITAANEPDIRLQHDGPVSYACFSPQGTLVATSSWDKTARIWNATTGEPVTAPLEHSQPVNMTMFSADGKFVLTACGGAYGTEADGSARVWNASTGEPVTPLLKHSLSVGYAAFSRDGARVITCSADHTARLWNARTGEPLTPELKHGHWVHHASFSPDGRSVLTASFDGTARLWDVNTGKQIGPSLDHGGASVYHASFSQDGCWVVTASSSFSEGGAARIWEIATGKLVSVLSDHQTPYVSQAWFSPDRRLVLTVGANVTRLWDVATGELRHPAFRHNLWTPSAMFSPDGLCMATASWDRTARVWDVTTGDPVTPPLHHGNEVYHVAFSPDGEQLLTASADKTAGLWHLTHTRNSEELVLLAQLLSGHRIDVNGRLVPLDTLSLERLWNTLQATYAAPSLAQPDEVDPLN
jgi:WD40 repeat protein/serine/threonine protein kinase